MWDQLEKNIPHYDPGSAFSCRQWTFWGRIELKNYRLRKLVFKTEVSSPVKLAHDEGLTLERSLESLYRGQIALSSHLIKPYIGFHSVHSVKSATPLYRKPSNQNVTPSMTHPH